MAGVVMHESDGVFALTMARDGLKSVPISSPQSSSDMNQGAWSLYNLTPKSLPE